MSNFKKIFDKVFPVMAILFGLGGLIGVTPLFPTMELYGIIGSMVACVGLIGGGLYFLYKDIFNK